VILEDPAASGEVPPNVVVENSKFAKEENGGKRVQKDPGENLRKAGGAF